MPFKLNGQGASDETTTGGPVPDKEPTAGTRYEAGTEKIELQGHALSVKDHSFRAALEADLNQDGRRDALLVLQDAHGVPRLATALSDVEGLGAIDLKGALTGEAESCVVENVELTRLSATFVLIRMRAACGAPSELPASAELPEAPPAPPEPGEPEPAAPAAEPVMLSPEPIDVLVRVDVEPAIVERMRIDEALATSEPVQVTVAWSASDVDNDGHIDLALKLTTQGDAQEPVELAMNLLDRPSGLALDTAAIEKTWLALAEDAKLARKGSPDRAYALAKRVIASHGALCRESGHALIEIDGERGIPCGPSLAAGRAVTIEAAVLARRGQLLSALERAEDIAQGHVYTVTENDRERIRYAIGERTKSVTWRAGPTVVLGAAPAVRRSAIAFLDEHRLLSRGVQGALAHDLTTGTSEPASATLADLVIRDPANKRAITSLATRCDGIHALITNPQQIVAGIATGAVIAEPLLWPSSHSVEACEKTSVSFDDAPELKVLGWTRSGIVIAVAGMLYAVPIDDASRAGPAMPLSALSPEAVAGFGAASVSSSGRMVLVPTAPGLVRVAAESTMLVAWPGGVTSSAVSDVAISPSGQRVAVLSGGRVQLADLNEPAAPVPSPTPEVGTTAPPAPLEPTNAPP